MCDKCFALLSLLVAKVWRICEGRKGEETENGEWGSPNLASNRRKKRARSTHPDKKLFFDRLLNPSEKLTKAVCKSFHLSSGHALSILHTAIHKCM